MTAISLPANAIVTLENAKTMTPAASAISVALLAYLSAGILMPSSHLEEPAIAQAPADTVKPTDIVKSARPGPTGAQAQTFVKPVIKHRMAANHGVKLKSGRATILAITECPCAQPSANAEDTPEGLSFIGGRAGKAPPLTVSHIFENLFRIPPREA